MTKKKRSMTYCGMCDEPWVNINRGVWIEHLDQKRFIEGYWCRHCDGREERSEV